MVLTIDKLNNKKEVLIEKNRPDDFIEELKHILHVSSLNIPSPLNIKFGIETIETLIAAHKSSVTGSEIYI